MVNAWLRSCADDVVSSGGPTLGGRAPVQGEGRREYLPLLARPLIVHRLLDTFELLSERPLLLIVPRAGERPLERQKVGVVFGQRVTDRE